MPSSLTEAKAKNALMFGRFRVLQELGAGMQGRVVRAFDTATRGEVALKVLNLQSAVGLLRFKTEFRTLVGLVHPNLVRIGELFERDQVWAFSMELVRGGDFLRWVRDEQAGFSETRLRAGLSQVISALHALHRARLIHRDIKPENVRVTPEGRVVLVDFGLVTEDGNRERTASQYVVGTVGYMAPELTAGEPATDKADLYALGAMLYQALTGRLPFDGTMHQVAVMQRTGMPARPSMLSNQVPTDLEDLCMALLAIEPEQRPSADSLYAQLCGDEPTLASANRVAQRDVFVGRERELSFLERKLLHSRASSLTGVVIRGDSGIGKSALMANFVRRVQQQVPEAIVLAGRCHPSEHVSYNAFDDIFEELTRLLQRLSDRELPACLPREAYLLPTLSPAFARVPGILVGADDDGFADDQRARLFGAFVELLSNLSGRFTLLITIDDLQWLDTDSAQLLRAMLDRARELRLGVLATARADDEELSAHVQPLLELPLETLELPPLDATEAMQLSSCLFDLTAPSSRVATLVKEAGGSPIFLIELLSADPHDPQVPGPHSLETALRARAARLPFAARKVLEAVSVASAPLPAGVLVAALKTRVEELYGALSLLRRERFVRETNSGELMSYHDRTRQAVASTLTVAETRALHAALAQVFESKNFESPLRAAQHWLLADDEQRAAPLLESAAARALENAAFEQAAELYRQRLSLLEAPVRGQARRALQVRLADALAAAGHCSESAHTLLEAVVGASDEQRRALSLRAAQQLLQAGELGAGMKAAALSLREVGLPWRENIPSALMHLALGRLQIRAARMVLPLTTRAAKSDALIEQQLETMLYLTQPLAWSDTLRSMEISARGLLLARSERRADYLPMLLAAEGVQATMRAPESVEADQLLREAESFLRPNSKSRERAYCTWAKGATALLKTKYAQAEQHLLEAERLYREECPSEAWMRVNARGTLLNTWLGLGAHQPFVERASEWIREAEAKGNAYALAYYSVGGQSAFRHAIADAPGYALVEIETVMQPWQASFGLHQLLRVKSTHDVLSYMGGDRAYSWWHDLGTVGPLAPAFFSEGFAWRKADATLRAAIARNDSALLAKASSMLKPLAHAVTPYVRVFAGITAMQIALMEQRYTHGLRVARAIRDDHARQDDFRMRVYEPVLAALEAKELPRASQWDGIRRWFAERGWHNSERALRWILPIAEL